MTFALDLSRLRQNPGRVEAFQLTSDALKQLPTGLKMESPVTVTAKAIGGDRQVQLQGRIETVLSTVCDRCLAPITYPLDFEFDEVLMSVHDINVLSQHGADREKLEEESWVYEDSTFDLSYLTVDLILAQVPLRHLCRDDCKGLCLHCGANLNHEACQCKENEIDPRWAILAQLENDGEV